MKGILVYAEAESERIHPVAFELLGKAGEISEKIGGEVWGIILGHEIKDLAPELIQYGADKVFVYDHPTLREFDVIRYKEILVDFVKKFDPEIFLIGATPLGRSLAPRVAAALGTGLTADCIDLRIDENGDLIQIRPAFTGNILAHIKTKGKPVMATVRYRVMEMPEKDLSRDGEIIEMEIPEIGETGLKVLGKVEERGVNLAEANIIVAG